MVLTALDTYMRRIRMCVIVMIAASSSVVGNAEDAEQRPSEGAASDQGAHNTKFVFTYSELSVAGGWSTVATAVRETVRPNIEQVGGRLFGIWHPLELAKDSPFDRLKKNELVVVAAWPDDASSQRTKFVDTALGGLDNVTSTRTRLFEPVVRLPGAVLTTGEGFYVHRFNKYAAKDVEPSVKLSLKAWETFEPEFGNKIVGELRERPDRDGVAQMVRIVWYKSYAAWLDSRNFNRDPESLRLFRERRKFQIDGEGVALGLVIP